MEQKLARGLAPTTLLALALSSTACTGILGGDGEGDTSESGSSPNASDNDAALMDANDAVADQIEDTDRILMEEDPELFAIADSYFPSDDPSASPTRYYRLSRVQLDKTAEHVLPGKVTTSALSTMPDDPLIRNYELANNLGFNAANLTPYVEWVTGAVENVRTTPADVVDCSGASDLAGCYAEQVGAFVRGSFRGVVSEADQARFVDFFAARVAAVGEAEATADLVDVTLNSPRFAFREEVFTDATAQLLEAEALQHLTYSLADVPPGALGFDIDNPGQYVSSPEAIAQSIETILASPEARSKLLRFFIAWLEISEEPDDFNISTEVFPEFTPELAAAMIEETTRFLETQLASAAPALKDVTESNQSFVSDALADIYGLDGGSGDLAVDLDPEQRRGIFTHPAFVASLSGPDSTKMVHRGAYFTRKVLCQELGEVPADAIPDGPIPGDTERERVEGVTAAPSCAGCHAFINPFGFMMENYDALGRWRTEDENGFPIDAAIEVDFLDEGPFSAESPIDGLTQFTQSAMFRQCFIKQLYTFYNGRQLAPSDDPTMREMFFRFSQDDNQQIMTALSIMAQSSNFNRRLEAQ